MKFILCALALSSFSVVAEDHICHLQIGATYRPPNQSPIDSKLPDNLVPGFYSEGANFRTRNWEDCYALALAEVQKIPPTGGLHFRNCIRFCGPVLIDGVGDVPGAFYLAWSFSDQTSIEGKVSAYTDKFVHDPQVGDQRFHADGSLFN